MLKNQSYPKKLKTMCTIPLYMYLFPDEPMETTRLIEDHMVKNKKVSKRIMRQKSDILVILAKEKLNLILVYVSSSINLID